MFHFDNNCENETLSCVVLENYLGILKDKKALVIQ